MLPADLAALPAADIYQAVSGMRQKAQSKDRRAEAPRYRDGKSIHRTVTKLLAQ
jgi:hypothetical protein